MMYLICTNDGYIPLWMRIRSGNEYDKKKIFQPMKQFEDQLTIDSLMVADSAI